AGHTVSGTQGGLDIAGVKGHRDAIIDGVLVDIKSASTFGFKKFEQHNLEQDDPFGYLDQINAYLFASHDESVLVEKRKVAFVAVEKSMGDICVDVYNSNDFDYNEKVEELRGMLSAPAPPARAFMDVPD